MLTSIMLVSMSLLLAKAALAADTIPINPPLTTLPRNKFCPCVLDLQSGQLNWTAPMAARRGAHTAITRQLSGMTLGEIDKAQAFKARYLAGGFMVDEEGHIVVNGFFSFSSQTYNVKGLGGVYRSDVSWRTLGPTGQRAMMGKLRELGQLRNGGSALNRPFGPFRYSDGLHGKVERAWTISESERNRMIKRLNAMEPLPAVPPDEPSIFVDGLSQEIPASTLAALDAPAEAEVVARSLVPTTGATADSCICPTESVPLIALTVALKNQTVQRWGKQLDDSARSWWPTWGDQTMRFGDDWAIWRWGDDWPVVNQYVDAKERLGNVSWSISSHGVSVHNFKSNNEMKGIPNTAPESPWNALNPLRWTYFGWTPIP